MRSPSGKRKRLLRRLSPRKTSDTVQQVKEDTMTRQFEVKKAEPINTYVRIALVGSAGSGKTFSALRLATGIGGKIVLIDTENKRSLKYSKKFTFDQLDFQPPFNPAS